MADEVRANAKAFRLENTITGLVSVPLLVITSDDGLAPAAKALVAGIEAKGGKKIARKPDRARKRDHYVGSPVYTSKMISSHFQDHYERGL